MHRITTLAALVATAITGGVLAASASACDVAILGDPAAATELAQSASVDPTQPTTPDGTDVLPPPVDSGPPRLRCTRSGSGRADVLRGTARRDVLCGLASKDVIRLGGFDAAYGGAGNDTIYARNGSFDVIVGGAGVDRAQVDPFDQLYGVETTF